MGQVIDYKDWQIALGRRFRALKLWFVLRSYGVEGIRSKIRHAAELATYFEKLLASAGDTFELMGNRNGMSLVCFRARSLHHSQQQPSSIGNQALDLAKSWIPIPRANTQAAPQGSISSNGSTPSLSIQELNSLNQRLLKDVNDTGEIFMIHTKLAGEVVLRLAIGGFDQSTGDIDHAWRVIRDCHKKLSCEST
jgi:tyrosine decarboxylase